MEGSTVADDGVTIADTTPIEARLGDLGFAQAILSGVLILPRNFFHAGTTDELLQEDSALDVRTVLRQHGLGAGFPSEQVRIIQENQFEWVLPTLYVAKDVLENTESLKAFAEALRDLYRLARGRSSPDSPVRFSVVLSKADGSTKRLDYAATDDANVEYVCKTAERIFCEDI